MERELWPRFIPWQTRMGAIGEKLSAQQPEIRVRVTEVQEAIRKILDGEHEGDGMGLATASGGIASALRVVETSDRAIPRRRTSCLRNRSTR